MLDVGDTMFLIHNLQIASKLECGVFLNWSLENIKGRFLLSAGDVPEKDEIIGLLNIYTSENGFPTFKSKVIPGFSHRIFDILKRNEYFKLSKISQEIGMIGRLKNISSELNKIKTKMQLYASNLYNVEKRKFYLELYEAPIGVLSKNYNSIIPTLEKILRITHIIPDNYTPPLYEPDPYLIAAEFDYAPSPIPIGTNYYDPIVPRKG